MKSAGNSDNHQAFIAMILGLTEADFTKNTAGKWTPGQQLDHIRLSVKPLVAALTMPDFVLGLLFGKANRASKSYEDLVAKYKRHSIMAVPQAGNLFQKQYHFINESQLSQHCRGCCANWKARFHVTPKRNSTA
jgi:hypothetical protein